MTRWWNINFEIRMKHGDPKTRKSNMLFFAFLCNCNILKKSLGVFVSLSLCVQHINIWYPEGIKFQEPRKSVAKRSAGSR
jgi:hypothetical protein